MDDFPPNSRRAASRAQSTPEPKVIEQVTSGEAHKRKKGLGTQFKETFVGGDARTTVQYVFGSVVLPAAREMMVNAASQGIERLIYGEDRGGRSRRGAGPLTGSGYSDLGNVQYNRMSQKPTAQRQMSPQSRRSHNFAEIEVDTRVEANTVIDRMFDILSQYGVTTVADLYALTGISGTHVDHKWGWTDLRSSAVRRGRKGGYILDLPNPEYLDA